MFLYAFRKKNNQKFYHFASNREFQNIKSLMPKFYHTFIHLYNLSKTRKQDYKMARCASRDYMQILIPPV